TNKARQRKLGLRLIQDDTTARFAPTANNSVHCSPVPVTRSLQPCKLEDRMKRVLLIVFVLIGLGVGAGNRFAGAESFWQYGRIVAVKKSVTTSTKAWVVNTPLDEERTQYTISIHVQDRIIVGNYEISATQSEPPPPEWTPGAAMKREDSGDSL